MVKVSDKSSEVCVKFPKTSSKFKQNYNLYLFSESGLRYSFKGLEDISEIALYYEFNIDFSEVEDGEYEYLIDNIKNDVGIIRIGNVRPTFKENNDSNKIIQYNE